MLYFKLILLIPITAANCVLKAKSEAQTRGNARILQGRIHLENERIEREAQRIYNERTGKVMRSTSLGADIFQ